MFWSILTDESDCKLQQCIFRFSKEEKIKLYLFVRCVMGMCDSPGLARLVLLKLAEKLKDEFPMAKETIKKQTYMDDIEVVGNDEETVAKEALNLIEFFRRGSFKAGKILSDNKKVLSAIPNEMLHPLVIEGLKLNEMENNDSVEVVRGETIAFPHPKLDDVVIEDSKALGIHFKIDLKMNCHT